MDWIQFFEDNHIDYVTRGSNTKRGEISVACPMCGEDDPSHHLGISLTTENWGCLRNPAHRGHKPNFLIASILGCSATQARLIVAQYSRPDPSDLEGVLRALEPLTEALIVNEGATLPTELKIIKPTGNTAKFWHYLESRGFVDVDRLIEDYGLYCALTGRWKDRVILPLYQDDKLVGWTGRAIGQTLEAPRYLSSSDAIKRTIFNVDELQMGGETLFVVEGPVDALKLDFYGKELGARATCVFGVVMTIDQISIINSLCSRFDRVVLLYDREAVEPAFHTGEWLTAYNVLTGEVPEPFSDPGEMDKKAVTELVRRYHK